MIENQSAARRVEVAEGFAVNASSEAGKHFYLPIVRKVTDEAVSFSNDGKIVGDAGSAGFLLGLFVSGDFSRRVWDFGNGGGGFFCEFASEHEFELGR